MAAAVNVAGLCTIKIDAGGGAGLETLGYSLNGLDHRSEGFFLNVPGDEKGGHDGPPIEVQYMGEIAIVRMELSKFDLAVATKIQARLANATEGTINSYNTAGTLMFGGSAAMRLLLHSVSNPANFPRAFCRGAFEINRGTRFSALVCEWECHANGSGVLKNSTTS